MKAPKEYLNDAACTDPASTDWATYDFAEICTGEAVRALELAIADAIADGDRRVREAEAKAEQYKNMLVSAILRSGRREALSPVPMSAA